jgi:transposase
MVHRARQGFVQQRTATLNRIRGLLSEFGIVLPLKAATVRREAAGALEDLPGWANTVVGDLLSEVHRLDERIAQYDRHIAVMAREDARARQLMRLSGVGETTATALLAMIGNGHEFTSGRQLSAWLGLVPGQYSSGGKTRLGRITKAGDAYLRSLLVLGARSVLHAAKASPTPSAAGRCNWPSAGGTGRPSSPSQPRTRAWPGRCCSAARTSSCLPEPLCRAPANNPLEPPTTPSSSAA